MDKVSSTKPKNSKEELILIPKYEQYMQYMIEVIIKIPRTEKFGIGNEYKRIMCETLDSIFMIGKVESHRRLYYLNNIDARLNTQRTLLRILYKNKWIDTKKYNVAFEKMGEIGKVLGGLIRYYAPNHKESV